MVILSTKQPVAVQDQQQQQPQQQQHPRQEVASNIKPIIPNDIQENVLSEEKTIIPNDVEENGRITSFEDRQLCHLNNELRSLNIGNQYTELFKKRDGSECCVSNNYSNCSSSSFGNRIFTFINGNNNWYFELYNNLVQAKFNDEVLEEKLLDLLQDRLSNDESNDLGNEEGERSSLSSSLRFSPLQGQYELVFGEENGGFVVGTGQVNVVNVVSIFRRFICAFFRQFMGAIKTTTTCPQPPCPRPRCRKNPKWHANQSIVSFISVCSKRDCCKGSINIDH